MDEERMMEESAGMEVERMKEESEQSGGWAVSVEIVDGYFTGNYAYGGYLDNAVTVDGLPEHYGDLLKRQCYRLNGGNWEFDREKYEQLLQRRREAEEQGRSVRLAEAKADKARESKASLARYLESHAVTSACHGGVEKEYSITSEKQAYLSQMILMAVMAQQSGTDYQPSWNASGEPCEYDWTLQELQQLASEIEAVVRPLVSRQQQIEVMIARAADMEELESIDISYGEA